MSVVTIPGDIAGVSVALALLLTALKLAGAIGMPWVWVVSPLWIAYALVLAVIGGLTVVFAAVDAYDKAVGR